MNVSMGTTALMLAVGFISLSAWAAPEPYRFPADGIEIKLPTSPNETRTQHSDGGYVNSYQSLTSDGTKKYSVFVNHGTGRVFADDAIDAYLKGLVKGLATGMHNAEVVAMEREIFKGFPGIRYRIKGTNDGLPIVAEGRVIIVDGDHIRLGTLYVDIPLNADMNDDSFFESFRLLPVDGALSGKLHTDKAGTFRPPADWELSKRKGPPQITSVFVSKSGHSITVIDSQTPGYNCSSYEAEISGMGVTAERGVVSTKQSVLTSYKTSMFNKEAGVRMTNITYCANTSKGAVLLIGAAPEQTAFRSSKLFDKVARSFKARK